MKSNFFEAFELFFEPENKLAWFVTEEFVSVFERNKIRDGKPSWKFLDEQLKKHPILFAMPLYSPYFKVVKKILMQLVEGGFANGKIGQNMAAEDCRPERTNNEVPALILDMEDLTIGFLLCLIPLALSVVAFFCELSSPIIIHLAKSARDLLIHLYVIKIVANMRIN